MLDLLFVAAHLHDPGHPLHGRRCHVGISGGRLALVTDADVTPEPAAARVVRAPDLHLSAGFFDLGVAIGEPHFESRETFATAAAAAARGGFTEVLVLPGGGGGAAPVQTRAAVTYVQQRAADGQTSAGSAVRFWPLAAATVDAAGHDLTEMHDLHRAGTVAFTDGPDHPLQRAEVLVRALQYLAPLGAVLLNRSEHAGLSAGGQWHEGAAATALGLRGLPALAEYVALARDLELLAYANQGAGSGARLHISQVSAAESVALLRAAKARGLPVTADIAAHQLAFTDATAPPFDTNFKVRPPFRSEADRQALLAGLADGTLDAVTSAHQPHEPESKELEFDLAEFGVIGLETTFSALLTYAGAALDLDTLLLKLTAAPRAVLGRPVPHLTEGAEANLTAFDPTARWTPSPATTASKARNSPFFGIELRGRVLGTVCGAAFSPDLLNGTE